MRIGTMITIQRHLEATTKILWIGVVLLFAGVRLVANPSGGAVANGAATITGTGTAAVTVTQSTDRSVINWTTFSIASGEKTTFVVPTSTSATLNRVSAGNPSAILGTLESNGQLFLVNPNGVFVGKGASINAQSFIASTYDLFNDPANGSFMNHANALEFIGNSTSSITNLGSITANGGDIFLIGRKVVNSGTLTASSGSVGLGAGSDVLIQQSGKNRISVLAGSTGLSTDVGVDNTVGGVIKAASVELKAKGNIYSLAVNNGGLIAASGVGTRDGHVWLTASGGKVVDSGKIMASDGNLGSTVLITGTEVTIKTGAVIDVSGPLAGGTILLGGGIRGADSSIFNSSQLVVESGTLLDARATYRGNGGRVSLWADDFDSYRGNISVLGGNVGGNGGVVDLGSGLSFVFKGNVYQKSPKGRNGTLYINGVLAPFGPKKPQLLNITKSVQKEATSFITSLTPTNSTKHLESTLVQVSNPTDTFYNLMVSPTLLIGSNNLGSSYQSQTKLGFLLPESERSLYSSPVWSASSSIGF